MVQWTKVPKNDINEVVEVVEVISLSLHVSRVASLSECSMVVFFNNADSTMRSESVTRELIELSEDS